jgi:hypothetical protein
MASPQALRALQHNSSSGKLTAWLQMFAVRQHNMHNSSALHARGAFLSTSFRMISSMEQLGWSQLPGLQRP